MSNLIAYHGDPALKASTIEKMKQHRLADKLARGRYWQDGKGCAVGCLTHDPDGGHDQYPAMFGLPEWLARLEDSIFEGLPPDQAQLWPERFLAAIPVGASFDGLADRLAVQRLNVLLGQAPEWPEHDRRQVVLAIERVIAALEGQGDLAAARSAAWSAAGSAVESATRSAARYAVESATRYAAESAARYAVYAAGSAVESATRSATRYAVESAARSAVESATRSAAWSAAWSTEADRLIAELKHLPSQPKGTA